MTFPSPAELADLRADALRPLIEAFRARILDKMRTSGPNSRGEYHVDSPNNGEVIAAVRAELATAGWALRHESSPRNESSIVVYPNL